MRDEEVLADLLRDALPEASVEVGAESVTVRRGARGIVWWRDGGLWASRDAIANTAGVVHVTARWLRGENPGAMSECADCGRRGVGALYVRSGVAVCVVCRDERDAIAIATAGYGWIVEDDGTVRPNRAGEAYAFPTYTAALERALAVVRTERDALRRGERP